MSGHSRWAQIKHKKAATDQKRGSLFSKLSKAISVAAKDGGDPASNLKLRLQIERAREANLPQENIERAVAKAANPKDAALLESVTYEAYGPRGSAILIEGITDNKNRTAAEIKHILALHGGKLAGAGAVAWLFARTGLILLEREKNPDLESSELDLELIDLGAGDIQHDPEGTTLTVPVEKRPALEAALKSRGLVIAESRDAMVATNPIDLPRAEIAPLLEALENHDDIQAVWSNLQEEN